MEITKIYEQGSEFSDLTNDKVTITMSMEQYLKLKNVTDFARYGIQNRKESDELFKAIEQADEEAKTKWV